MNTSFCSLVSDAKKMGKLVVVIKFVRLTGFTPEPLGSARSSEFLHLLRL